MVVVVVVVAAVFIVSTTLLPFSVLNYHSQTIISEAVDETGTASTRVIEPQTIVSNLSQSSVFETETVDGDVNFAYHAKVY